jgi:hypothetical protein
VPCALSFFPAQRPFQVTRAADRCELLSAAHGPKWPEIIGAFPEPGDEMQHLHAQMFTNVR